MKLLSVLALVVTLATAAPAQNRAPTTPTNPRTNNLGRRPQVDRKITQATNKRSQDFARAGTNIQKGAQQGTKVVVANVNNAGKSFRKDLDTQKAKLAKAVEVRVAQHNRDMDKVGKGIDKTARAVTSTVGNVQSQVAKKGGEVADAVGQAWTTQASKLARAAAHRRERDQRAIANAKAFVDKNVRVVTSTAGKVQSQVAKKGGEAVRGVTSTAAEIKDQGSNQMGLAVKALTSTGNDVKKGVSMKVAQADRKAREVARAAEEAKAQAAKKVGEALQAVHPDTLPLFNP